MIRHLATLACLALLSLGPAAPLAAQDRPMLMDGKERLFQRVLVRDRVAIRDTPDGPEGQILPPLKPLYVYAREDGWVRAGLDDDGTALFWVPEDAVTNWNQTIVATLEGSENVGRLMFFNDIDPIFDVIESENPAVPAAALRDEAEAAEAGGAASDTVVALGPRAVIDQRENLYVMPILEFEEAIFDSGSFVNLLRIAVARAQPEASIPDAPRPRRDATPEQFRAGVVFVVDTTISMEPYIRATQAALEEVYREIEGANVSNAVSFGLIDYRDSLQAAPELGYATRTFVTLQEGTNPQNFLTGIAQMDEAGSTSRNFREDSYAGIEHALTQLDWSGFDARFIVLVSDAGPREAGDEYSQTGLSGEGLNRVVRERIDGAIVVMHLKTPGGASDHAKAEAAYRELARYPNQPPFYFPIENGDPEEFRKNARGLGRLISQQVVNFRGKAAPEGGDAILSEDDPVARRFAGVMSAGRTMQLAFLGQSQGARAPDVFEAWVADRDFDRPGLKPLSIRVLISKRDLSNLQEALRIIIEEGENSVIDPDQFFSQVLGAAADMSRRPDQVSRQADPSLAHAVAIDEYIEDLPYRSRIMSITEREWLDQSFAEQQSIINELYDKIERYARYNEATDQWVDYLGTGAQAENLLYPMPLDDLP